MNDPLNIIQGVSSVKFYSIQYLKMCTMDKLVLKHMHRRLKPRGELKVVSICDRLLTRPPAGAPGSTRAGAADAAAAALAAAGSNPVMMDASVIREMSRLGMSSERFLAHLQIAREGVEVRLVPNVMV